MQKVLLVTTPDGFFAQGEMPWSSLDLKIVTSGIADAGFQVRVVDYDYLKGNFNETKGYVIIFTSSQRVEHKNYIEDIMFLLKDDNLLIPRFDSLKAHDNKGFQCLMDRKYDLGLIPCDYFADISEVRDELVKYPYVFKPANGASSTGVAIVKNKSELRRKLIDVLDYSFHDVKKSIKKYIFKKRYNEQWERYIGFGKKRFILQEFVPDLTYDYKIIIFGDKYYALKRFVAEDDFRASGSGFHSREFDDEINLVLEKAHEFKGKYSSHIYSLDFCINKEQVQLIEFQFTHIGPVTLSDSTFYFIRHENGDWHKKYCKSNLEVEFTKSVLSYINENITFCS
jgi:hypothetical protein